MKTMVQRVAVPMAAAAVVGVGLALVANPLLGLVVGLAGMAGLVVVLVKADAELITQLRQNVEKIESGLQPEGVTTPRHDEVAALVAAVNRLGKHDKATQQANSDPLTGLANRRGVLSKLEGAFKRQQPLTLFYIDLDKFKPVNDQYGHEMGDAVLMKVAELMLACVRENDTVARLGGDEFLIVFYGLTDKALIEERANKVLDLLNEPMWVNNTRIKIGGSVGITIAPQDGATVEALMQAADETMYAVKKAGRNAFRFYS
ncbi:MAG: diguanylate cyclase domain-containing protein [Pseudomonadota bacterium]|jgi:diguanylate cyclase (GGDEF)-like protein